MAERTQRSVVVRTGAVLVALATAAALMITLAPTSVRAQVPGQVTGLTAVQEHGFTTLAWEHVDGAAGYEIERTPVDGDDDPTGDAEIVGVWRPDRHRNNDEPRFADSGFDPGDRFSWRVRGVTSTQPNVLTVDAPSSAAGTYDAAGASFGPEPGDTGVSGAIVLVDAGGDDPTEGCDPLVGFPAGAIALVDRGSCNFTTKVGNAQAAGAIAVIVANDRGGPPTNLGGSDDSITIPAVMISEDAGAALEAGLPASGTIAAAPTLPFSEPVTGTTLPQWGDPTDPGEGLRTGFEQRFGGDWTSDTEEYAYTAAIDDLSDRVRVVEIARTVLGRPVNMLIIGHPAPLPTAEAISDSPTLMYNCNVHGDEPSSREACLILARQLAFGDDARTIDLLSNFTVLIVPSINGDGRAADTRGNATGQDLNRDHSLLRQPETFGFAEALRDYTPEVAIDGHEGATQDIPVLGPRHLNVYEGLYRQAKEDLIEGWHYDHAAESGWWVGPYNSGGLSQETILRNTFGLKNIVGQLQENRPTATDTRPTETSYNGSNTRMRRVYGALWHHQSVLDFYRANQPAIAETIAESIAFQVSNSGPVVFRGSWPWPPLAPNALDPPNPEPPDDDEILQTPPCGYLMTPAQYTTVLNDDPDVPVALRTSPAERLEAHGITVEHRTEGVLVRMAQPQRGLIAPLLDPQAAEPMLDAQRLTDDCPPPCEGPITVDGVATSVTDALVDGDCISQTIGLHDDWDRHGTFLTHLQRSSWELYRDGVLTARERLELVRVAALSDIGGDRPGRP